MTSTNLTDRDLADCAATVAELNAPAVMFDCCRETGNTCDCYQSEVVMLSNGYAKVYRDGDVIQYGALVARFDVDTARRYATWTV